MNAPANLPNWPRLLSEDEAAAYLGVGKTRFREKWQARVWPQPIREGRRVLWDRKALDSFVDVLAGTGAPSNTWDDL